MGHAETVFVYTMASDLFSSLALVAISVVTTLQISFIKHQGSLRPLLSKVRVFLYTTVLLDESIKMFKLVYELSKYFAWKNGRQTLLYFTGLRLKVSLIFSTVCFVKLAESYKFCVV